jgi:ribosomal protein S20
MPRRKSSIQWQRASKKKHLRNLKVKQQLKKSLKKFQTLLSGKNTSEAKPLLQKIFSQLDKAAKKGIIRSGTASRKKSRLTLGLTRADAKSA